MKVEARVVGKVRINPDEHIVLDHVYLRDADYSNRRLMQFGTIGSRLDRCSLKRTDISTAQFGAGRELSEFTECDFDGSRLVGGGGFSRFVRCSFREVDLRNWICFKSEFIDCVFSGRLTQCIFNGTVPERDRSWVGRERNEFRGNDFSGAELIDVAFRTGIDLEQQRLPIGPDYVYVADAEAAIERARKGLVDWMPGTDHQRRALVMVDVYSDLVKNGQRQLLLQPSRYSKRPAKIPREVVDKVVELFRGPN